METLQESMAVAECFDLIEFVCTWSESGDPKSTMMCQIFYDVKVAAMRLYELDVITLDDILDCCRFSIQTFYRILKLWRQTGNVVLDIIATRASRPTVHS